MATIYRKLEVFSKLELATHLNGEVQQPRSPSEMAAVVSELALSLEEAISREKALSEVLRIVSAAQGDLNAVMPLILTYALELCDAEFGILFEHQQEAGFMPITLSEFRNRLRRGQTIRVSLQSAPRPDLAG